MLCFSMLPIMFTAYMLQYLDKTALGNTAIFGIQKSLVSISPAILEENH
jgi:hypothetical protein